EWPADVYLEGPDQYRGWFHSSLLVATGTRDAAPYRGVVTHGWTLDEQGRPMSKSLGNVITPAQICEKWGADLLRLWVASVVYQAIHDYCVVNLSAFYFDVLKDRLYTKAPKNKLRRSAQTAVWKISDALVRLAAPVLVFTTEEIWKFLPKAAGRPESVHMAVF